MLGFWPHDIRPYRQALLHKSMQVMESGHRINNERLEFLGDAIIDAVVADILYGHFKDNSEGFLTKTRSKIVQRESLNHVAEEIGLQRLVKSNTHGCTSHNSYLGGNALEALVGAIYIDRGYAHCKRFVEQRILSLIDIDKIATKEINFKSRLLEWSQKNKVQAEFVLASEDMEDSNTPTFVTQVTLEGIVCGEGRGYSKKESQQLAAKHVLNHLRRHKDLQRQILDAKMRRTATACIMATLLLGLGSCANIGSPDGGRYDEEPPVVVSSSPANKAVNNKSKKISIKFNEYIKLESASEKVVISPPQMEQPNVRAVNKSVKVDLYDSLQANTTYTIDFSDAIVDNNESNPMGKYTFSFSTGPTIDTMEIAGTVLNAENLEPVKGLLVGLYPKDSLWSDTVFTSSAFVRMGRTNGSGEFTIKGIKSGDYRAFALNDMDNNYFFSQKSEIIAWDTITLSTSSKPDLRPDTVWLDSTHIEKINMLPYIHYYPDKVVLMSFLEEGQDKHLLKTERLKPELFTLYFTAPQDSLPCVTGLNFDDSCLLPEPSVHNDTITYWITDTTVAYRDTLTFSLTYLDTDTLGVDQSRTDTITLTPKTTHARIEKERRKQIEEWEKDMEKRRKHSKEPLPEEPNPFETIFMDVKMRPGTAIAPNQNLVYTFSEPVSKVDTTKLHFYIKIDSNYVEHPFLFLPNEGKVREYTLYAEWQGATTYQFVADSLAFISDMGHPARSVKTDVRVKSDDEFGSIFIKLKGNDPNCVVQLLDKSDKPVAEQLAEDGHADFYYLKPGDYYMRMYIDRNANGKWDTGEYSSQTQPEEVFYFPRPIPLRAKFEVEQSWDYRSIERTKQKPKEITKQKPDKEKTIKSRNQEREEEKSKQKKK